ncbi:MAG: hypothetical protein PF549_02155 [Patescibacteria group bacterium]|jgi:hypothetical protein|nr:hypothetical protein [Patescibacteria group bacterium]
MRASSRKIFKKIGAGLMLGLSLFNLGAAWNKTEGWNTAKRSKKLRVKEKDQIDEEVVVFAEIAEEEAEKAIKERSGFQKEQVVEKIETTLSQKIYRTTAVGLLSVALGVFATSMIFNAPFSLGKGLLSLLPGNPHMAVFSLSSEKEVVNAGDDFTVIARLDSAGEQVDDLKLVINYNPSLVSFEKHNSYINWNVQEKQISDNKRELIFLSDKEKFLPHIF